MRLFLRIRACAFICAIAAIVCTSCKKGDGGEQGVTGAQGPQGIQGVAGLDGKTILSGNSSPAAATGTNGDFYLDLSSSNFYGPKTSNGWGQPISIKGMNGATGATGAPGATGATGKDGKNGSQLLSGSGAPDASLGVIGDYYIKTSTAEMYGPKTLNGWGSAISFGGASSSTAQTFLIKGHKLQTLQDNSYEYGNGKTIERYAIQSQIILGDKFTQLDDLTIAFYYARMSNTPTSIWRGIGDNGNAAYLIGGGPNRNSNTEPIFYLYNGYVNQGIMAITGWSESVSKSVLEGGIDIRIVLIKSSTVQTLSAKNVDMNNFAAVQQALKIN